MTKCGDCILGVLNGAVCTLCKGTGFVAEKVPEKEGIVEKVKNVVKKK